MLLAPDYDPDAEERARRIFPFLVAIVFFAAGVLVGVAL